MPEMSRAIASLPRWLYRAKAAASAYRIREVDGQDEEIAETLTELHHLTFFDGAPIPSFDWGHWWLAYSEKAAIAFAGLVPSTHARCAGYIHRVGVLAEHRGHGLQLRLLRAMEARAGRQRWSCVVSDTTRNIASANKFIRAGYRLYQPRYPWAFSETLYWYKAIRPGPSPHGTHSKRL
jgi:GNAT superfamily N-acetyltransferase